MRRIFNILRKMEKKDLKIDTTKAVNEAQLNGEPQAPSQTMLDAFFRIHDYLVAHSTMPIRRQLMDEINWNDRLIAIKGGRGAGKTDFLLTRIKEIETEWRNMPVPLTKRGKPSKRKSLRDVRPCLYVSMNDF